MMHLELEWCEALSSISEGRAALRAEIFTSDLVGFWRSNQLESQAFNNVEESVQTCTIDLTHELSICANFVENHWHTKAHVELVQWWLPRPSE